MDNYIQQHKETKSWYMLPRGWNLESMLSEKSQP